MNYKVYVGNIPQCTLDEFQNIFVNMPGYITSDIRKYPTTFARGYGYVVFNNETNGHNAIKTTCMLHGKLLKLSTYNNRISETHVTITNISDQVTSSELYHELQKHGVIKKFTFVRKTSTAIITYEHAADVIKLCSSGFNLGNIQLPWFKQFQTFNTYWFNTQQAYQAGFKLGFILGQKNENVTD